MRLVVALLVLGACGRLHFDGATDALAIVSPAENAEVEDTAIVTGTCRTGLAIELGGSGLATAGGTVCEGGAYAAIVTFTDGDGAKLVTVTQGAVTVSRTFVRVTPIALRAATSATAASVGFTLDCDLAIPAPELAPGDVLFGMIYSDGGGSGSVATPGFTRTQLAGSMYVAFWKLATVNEPATYTFRIVAGTGPSDTCEAAGVLSAWSGVAPAAPVLAESANVDGNDPSVVALGVTAPQRGVLVGAWGSNGPASGFSLEGMDVASSAVSSDGFANVLLAFEGIAAAGPTGDRTATLAQTRGAAAGLFVLNGKP